MAEHAHNTPTLARRRHVRAAPGASDRRAPASAASTLIVRVPVADDDGFPFTVDAAAVQLRWRGTITPGLRQRIEREVELGIALLDALDAAGEDLEPEEDHCEAGDDKPAAQAGSWLGIGSEDDAEEGGDAEPTDDDMLAPFTLPGAVFPRHTTACSNGPFQPDSATYAALRGWRAGRPA